MLTILRALSLLRCKELVEELGEWRFRLLLMKQLRSRWPTAKISSDIQLPGFRPDLLELGDSVTICPGNVIAFGDELNGFGAVHIGARTWIGQYNNLRGGGGDVLIGSDCLISQFCTLVASNHGTDRTQAINVQAPETHRSGVVLGDDVWLGAGVIVTPGVTIAKGAVIGANAVVTRNVPEYEIWAGIPAKKIGHRN